jgi:hypothetical protein
MTKAPVNRGGTARIRFVMLDAEIPEGDLSQVAQAIQNAIKPTTIVQQRLVTAPPQGTITGNSHADNAVEEPPAIESATEDADVEETGAEPKRPIREPRTRKNPTPKVLALDLNSALSWENYATAKNPKNDTEKYLTVAAWFKEHHGEDAITANHVYACFRAMKWSYAISDFAGPLRHLKRQQLMTSPERGKYAINHIGLAHVEEFGKK